MAVKSKPPAMGGVDSAWAKRCLQCDLRLHLGCNPVPPQDRLLFDQKNINQVPATEGVFQLLDGKYNVLIIKGTANLCKELLSTREGNDNAGWFEFEEDKMYSKRESQLIQKYVQEHGEMPGGGGDDFDGLFYPAPGRWLLAAGTDFFYQKPEASSKLLFYYLPQINKFAAVKTKGFKKGKQVG